MNYIKMLYYHRTDISKGINVNQTSTLEECIICHYLHLLDKGFQFEPAVWNCCHDSLMTFMSLNDIDILNIHDVDYRCIIN